MIKKLLLVSGFLLVSIFSWHSSSISNTVAIQSVQATDTLITPFLITLYDENGDVIPSFSTWADEVWEPSTSPTVNPGAWFGIYQFATRGKEVYMAIGVDRPAGTTGAIFGKAVSRNGDPRELVLQSVPVNNRNNIPYVEEDGLHEMEWLNNENLLIAGTDPAYTDGWSGNVYNYNANSNLLTKVRCYTDPQAGDCGTDNFVFPAVIHFFGVSVVGNNVYLGGSTDIGGGQSDGVVFKSTNLGSTWEQTEQFPTDFYRVKDIIGFQDTHNGVTREYVFAALADKFINIAENALYYSSDQNGDTSGVDWDVFTPGTNKPPHTFAKGTLYKGYPIFVESTGDSLLRVKKESDGSLGLDDISLTQFTINRDSVGDKSDPNYYRHHVLVATNDWLYVLGDDNAVYKSTLIEPITWTKVSQFESSDHIISLAYWGANNGLLATSRGLNAKLFYIDLPETPIFSTAKIRGATCDAFTPEAKPELFSVVREKTKATLYINPVKNVTGYYVSYGLGSSLDQFGTDFEWGNTNGAISYTIYDLDPKATYSFSVRAQNDCQPGEWSNKVTANP